MSKPLMDISELSLFLKVPKSTIYGWVYKRQIPFLKMGRHLRFEFEVVLTVFSKPSIAHSRKTVLNPRTGSLKIAKLVAEARPQESEALNGGVQNKKR